MPRFDRRLIRAFFIAAFSVAGCTRYESRPLDRAAVDQALAHPTEDRLTVAASKLKHPILQPLELRPEQGLDPDKAAVLAVLLNPSLNAERDRRNIAVAQTLQAGILPNPQFTYNYDFVTGGNTLGTLNAYGLGVNWDVTSLLTHRAKVNAARANEASVALDVAWQEWQIAEAAKSAVYDLVSLQAQIEVAESVDKRLTENADLVHRAADQGLKTALDVSAAESAAQDSHTVVMTTRRDLDHQRLVLNRAIGLPPDARVELRPGIELPSHFDPPAATELLRTLEAHRLDLLGLKRGYESQEATLLAAVQGQFPKINIGFNRASDTTDVHTLGPAVSIDIPIFDRNQGAIASETATRQQLFDDYVRRVFEARSDIATAIADIHSIGEQITATENAIPNLRKLVEVYQSAIDHGNADVLSFYGAQNNLSQKMLDVLKLKQQLAANRIALEIAAGQFMPDAVTGPRIGPATEPSLTSAARINP